MEVFPHGNSPFLITNPRIQNPTPKHSTWDLLDCEFQTLLSSPTSPVLGQGKHLHKRQLLHSILQFAKHWFLCNGINNLDTMLPLQKTKSLHILTKHNVFSFSFFSLLYQASTLISSLMLLIAKPPSHHTNLHISLIIQHTKLQRQT